MLLRMFLSRVFVSFYVMTLANFGLNNMFGLWPSAAAMNSEILQHHCIEEVTINGVDLVEYKHQPIYTFKFFKVISQV